MIYPIHIGNQLLSSASKILAPHIQGSQILIVTQKNIPGEYLSILQQQLKQYQCDVIYLNAGESYKTLEECQTIFSALLKNNHQRSTTLIALGGGIVGDMTGFAAACYQRGVNYIQIPTTLIAQVDSSIGGKTGVNHALGKNMIGVFHQPQCVLIDIDTLQTLPEREFIAGMAEVIKYSLIHDAEFFDWLTNNIPAIRSKQQDVLLSLIKTCVKHKLHFVMQDERDHGVRRLLNFGHTFGHAIETAFAYQDILHGEAVAIGMMMAAQLSAQLGFISEKEVAKITFLLAASGLNVTLKNPLDINQLIALMKKDKKRENNQSKFILLKAIGKAEEVAVDEGSLFKMALLHK